MRLTWSLRLKLNSRVHWSGTQLNVAENEINLQALKLEMNGVEEGAIEFGEADGVGKTAETNIEIFQSSKEIWSFL